MQDLFRYSLGITRQIPLKKVNELIKMFGKLFFLICIFFQSARLTTGPEIRGCRPILVTFHNFKVGNHLLFDSPFSHLVLSFVIDCQHLSTFVRLEGPRGRAEQGKIAQEVEHLRL